jgi:hypothetical protein
VINYKSTNGIFIFHKHLETNHHELEGWWSEQNKGGPKAKKQPTKKWSTSTLVIISNFSIFVCYPKNDPHQKQCEEELVLLII